MEGMRDIARSYYERANEETKKAIKESFTKLDVNGDGKISLKEFKKSVKEPSLCAEAVLQKLDWNGDGSLDFEEFLCLHYMDKKVGIARCVGCLEWLVGPYFSCLLCIREGAAPYDLCCSCYRRTDIPHCHSVDNMLDHHSLVMDFKNRAAPQHKSQNKKEMEELREIAKAHYRAGSPQVRTLADEFYRSMDSDGDGRVDLSEFLSFMRQEGYSNMQNLRFFDVLNVDGKGTLDFYEVMTLYYIFKSGRPFCNCCGIFIPGIFFSCVECFKNPKTSFNLCRDCYGMAKCNHNHYGRAQFLDNYTLLQAMRDPAFAQASGVYLNQAWNRPTDAIVPFQHHAIVPFQHQPTYNIYMVNPHNAVVPAPPKSNWEKCKAKLHEFEIAVSIGSIATTLCTIL